MTNQTYILLGSNMGDKALLLQEARALLNAQAGKITRESSLYESEPWGFNADEWFINQVVELYTGLSPEALLKITQGIEQELGRVKGERVKGEGYVPRTMDIDILFYNEMIVQTPPLTIPHPLLHERRFTLLPMAEIAGEYTHPVFKKTIAALLEQCGDHGSVRRL